MLTNRQKNIVICFQHYEKKIALISLPVWAVPVLRHPQEQPKHVQSVRSPVFSLPVYIDSPSARRHPIYRLSAELIDILSICTSFCWIDCAKEQVGKKQLAISNCLLLYSTRGRTSRGKKTVIHGKMRRCPKVHRRILLFSIGYLKQCLYYRTYIKSSESV